MKKRIGILLAFVLCACALCMGALADGNGTITVGGNYTNGIVFDAKTAYAITNRNGEVKTDGASEDNYNIYWNDATSTLTLRNANIEGNYNNRGIIHSSKSSITIVLEGENNITSGYYSSIYVDGEVTITGDGTLSITASDRGIRAGDVEINGTTVNIKAPSDFGIYATTDMRGSGNVTINNSNVKIESGSFGIYSGDDSLAPSGDDTGNTSISNSTVVINLVSNTYAMLANGGGINIEGSSVEINQTVEGYYPAVYSNENVSISGGSEVNVHNVAGISIQSAANIEIDGSTVVADGGLYTLGTITVSPVIGAMIDIKVGPNQEPYLDSPYGEEVSFSGSEISNLYYRYVGIKPHEHTGEIVWSVTSSTHKGYYDCCGTEVPEGEHVFDRGVCTVCGYKRPVNLPTPHDIELTVFGGGEALLSLNNASAGATITVTATPDEGFELGYITVDGERIDGTTFTMPDHDVTVRVYFAAIGAALPFTDVAEGEWFYGYVEYVYENGLMDGVSDTTFEPNAEMTRAMVWAILARIDGETVTGVNWAETAREWAMANGVSDGEDANGYVTREQLATMLWRYAGEPASSYSLSAYTDAGSVSGYAATAMAWAVEQGIITGVTDATLEPQGTATRAQCAAILMRFMENVK